ncbi:MAG: mannosyltransferase family protein [Microgenomates group bacterium]
MEQWYYKQIAPRAKSSGQPTAPSIFRLSLLLFFLSRLYFLFIALLSSYFIRTEPGYLGVQVSRGEPLWAWVWANMDGRHFINIATLGYTGTNFAYFPLYPLLINLVTRAGLTPILSGIFISITATTLSAFYLLRLIALDKLKISKFETLLLFFFFPFGFILNSVYADALFLFLTTASFYYARKGKWLTSGVFALFASLTRLSGLALLPALIIEWWLQKKPFKKAMIASTLSLAGFVTYSALLQITQGNWRLFQSSMSAWKQDKFVLLPQVFFRYLKILISVSPNTLVYWVAVLELISFILYFLLAVYVFRKIRASYGVFMMVLLVLVSFTGTFAGTPRYLIHLFPAFIGLALLLKNYPWFRLIYYPVTIVLGVLITAFFVQGYFVG